jgi:hypothetical protein
VSLKKGSAIVKVFRRINSIPTNFTDKGSGSRGLYQQEHKGITEQQAEA